MKIVSSNIFTKCKGDALTSEEFSDFISKNEIHEFYIGGADAVACVKSTCYNLFGGISFVVFCRNIGQASPANSASNTLESSGNFIFKKNTCPLNKLNSTFPLKISAGKVEFNIIIIKPKLPSI